MVCGQELLQAGRMDIAGLSVIAERHTDRLDDMLFGFSEAAPDDLGIRLRIGGMPYDGP